MPDLLEHMYCAQQINIPPNLPYILKQYAKAAIRTQPHDLLFWSAAYFRAKANNSPPPVKERLEYPPFDSPSRLSPGFLRVLHKQLGNHEYVRVEVLYEKWMGVCLVKEALDSMLRIGNIQNRVPWLKFIAIASGHLCNSLSKTMILICEVLTDQPEGGAAWIPVDKFVDLYQFLAVLNCGPQPPNVKHVELLLESPSVTSTHVSTSVAEVKDPEPMEVEEKDSTAGLMVWQDVQPQEKSDRIRSPKAEDEPGASSEIGVEVFDDAKGAVTELVTLYPVTTKSELSQDSESSLKATTATHKGDLEDDDEKEKDQPAVLAEIVAEETTTEMSAKSDSKTEDKLKTKTEDKLKTKTEENVEDNNGNQDNLSENLDHPEESEDKTEENELQNADIDSEKETSDLVSEEAKPQEEESLENVIIEPAESENDVSDSVRRDRTDSEIAVDQTITMANFIGKRQVGLSVVEIRRGRFGDKSIDQIDSGEGPMASPTVHRLATESDESIETEEEEKEDKSSWDYVPGIGPVIPEAQILAVVEYMQYWASKQQGMVGPRNITHLLCPPLDLPTPAEDDTSVY
ncbi:uncharacterized protein LOC128995925 isoform X2 [Macrosteles quadrilineatus]|uniref:uncharacterized protein LOC128995925 isoform X2 n=1 Tax=Macrosteles quadrilineatus TaxID=74068 RepID=UPI0023E12D05|nr:uncharacterized protein LOC128995925 isoform X2 [Macrosteles quadrilineatus]